MDGGAITFDRADIVATWRRENGVYLSTATVPEQKLGPGRFPSLLALAGATVVAWEHQGQIAVQTIAR